MSALYTAQRSEFSYKVDRRTLGGINLSDGMGEGKRAGEGERGKAIIRVMLHQWALKYWIRNCTQCLGDEQDSRVSQGHGTR